MEWTEKFDYDKGLSYYKTRLIFESIYTKDSSYTFKKLVSLYDETYGDKYGTTYKRIDISTNSIRVRNFNSFTSSYSTVIISTIKGGYTRPVWTSTTVKENTNFITTTIKPTTITLPHKLSKFGLNSSIVYPYQYKTFQQDSTVETEKTTTVMSFNTIDLDKTVTLYGYDDVRVFQAKPNERLWIYNNKIIGKYIPRNITFLNSDVCKSANRTTVFNINTDKEEVPVYEITQPPIYSTYESIYKTDIQYDITSQIIENILSTSFNFKNYKKVGISTYKIQSKGTKIIPSFFTYSTQTRIIYNKNAVDIEYITVDRPEYCTSSQLLFNNRGFTTSFRRLTTSWGSQQQAIFKAKIVVFNNTFVKNESRTFFVKEDVKANRYKTYNVGIGKFNDPDPDENAGNVYNNFIYDIVFYKPGIINKNNTFQFLTANGDFVDNQIPNYEKTNIRKDNYSFVENTTVSDFISNNSVHGSLYLKDGTNFYSSLSSSFSFSAYITLPSTTFAYGFEKPAISSNYFDRMYGVRPNTVVGGYLDKQEFGIYGIEGVVLENGILKNYATNPKVKIYYGPIDRSIYESISFIRENIKIYNDNMPDIAIEYEDLNVYSYIPI